MWNDIDLYHAVRDFTSDPVTFPGGEMRAFIRELVRYSRAFLSTPLLSRLNRFLGFRHPITNGASLGALHCSKLETDSDFFDV